MSQPLPLSLSLPAGPVSALAWTPAEPVAALVLAHGAGAGMTHPFMAALAEALAERGIATLRFQFPSMERGLQRPDPPAVAHAAVRAAVAEAHRRWPTLPLYAGGKSFGARMTSQAQAAQHLPGVQGLVFFGFPLHPAGKPGTERAAHLAQVQVPMLCLQGDRDALAELPLLRAVVAPLQERLTLDVQAGADHGFHVLKRSGRSDAEVLAALAAAVRRWTGR